MLSVLILAVFGGSKRMRWIAVGSVVVVVALGGLIKLERNTAFVQRIGFLERLASISITDQTIASRFINMSIALKGVKERPVFGWGQENYAVVFDKYYDPRMYRNEPWFDRVHDIIFDWWVTGGTLGLLAYLSIFAATLWALWRSGAFTLAERAILTGLLAGYFVHNLTVFDNITSYILFGTLLAYIAYRSSEHLGAKPIVSGEISRNGFPYAVLVFAVLTAGVVWQVNANAFFANRTLLAAISQQGNPDINLAYFEKAISYGSLGTQEAREQLSQGASQIARATEISLTTKQAFYDVATREMQAQEKVSPLDARFPLFLGVVYQAFGNYEEAARSFNAAHLLSLNKQSIYYEIGQNAIARGDFVAAVAAFKTAFELETSNMDARIFYAAGLIRAGNDAAAQELLKPAIEADRAADSRILSAYSARKRLDLAIPLWQAHIVAKPDDAQAYFTLAALYFSGGNSAKAIATLEAAAKAVPSVASQTESVIQQIRSGTAKMQ